MLSGQTGGFKVQVVGMKVLENDNVWRCNLGLAYKVQLSSCSDGEVQLTSPPRYPQTQF